MAQIANIVVNDGLPTPVPHTFVPVKIVDETAYWEDRAVAIPLGYNTLMLNVKRPKNISERNAAYRVNVKLVTPVLEVTSPATGTGIQPGPTLSTAQSVAVEFVLSPRGAEQERENLRVMMVGLLQNPIVIDAIEKLSNAY